MNYIIPKWFHEIFFEWERVSVLPRCVELHYTPILISLANSCSVYSIKYQTFIVVVILRWNNVDSSRFVMINEKSAVSSPIIINLIVTIGPRPSIPSHFTNSSNAFSHGTFSMGLTKKACNNAQKGQNKQRPFSKNGHHVFVQREISDYWRLSTFSMPI